MIVGNSLTRTQFPDSLYIIYDSREVTKKKERKLIKIWVITGSRFIRLKQNCHHASLLS